MSKVMLVTMGTSLFHSATWQPAEELPREYREWATDENLTSPEKRKTCGAAARIKDTLQKQLLTKDPDAWAELLPEDFKSGEPSRTAFMRYSAELATILKLAEEERRLGQTHGDFLRGYEEILLVHDADSPDSGGPNLPMVAARHLKAYLGVLLGDGGRVQTWKIPGLSSPQPERLLGESSGLGLLGKEIQALLRRHHQLDLVISGGYKIYGIFLSPLLGSEKVDVRILYIHEEGEHLLVISRGAKRKGGSGVDSAGADLLRNFRFGLS